MPLTLTWFGHAAFLLEADGVRVLLDPYRTPDVGTYAAIATPADVVLVSHLNPKYHSHWEAGLGDPICLNGLAFADDPDGVEARGIQFRAVRVWESPTREEPVTMTYFVIGGVSVCHSGDLGHAMSEEEAAPIRGVDVFLAVVGGPPTAAIADIKAAIDLIRPKIVIPMHYQTGKVNLDLRPVEDFLALFKPSRIVRAESPTIAIAAESLPVETQVIVLPSAR